MKKKIVPTFSSTMDRYLSSYCDMKMEREHQLRNYKHLDLFMRAKICGNTSEKAIALKEKSIGEIAVNIFTAHENVVIPVPKAHTFSHLLMNMQAKRLNVA